MFDHAATIKRFATLDDSSLQFIINDCREAIAAMPSNPKCSQYQDEIHYAASELNRRKDFIVGIETERHVEVTVTPDGFALQAILFIRNGEKVLARSFASRQLKTRSGAISAAHKWLLRKQVNQS